MPPSPTSPTYTILCPLYREAGVLPQLVKAIAALDYPRSRLDVKLLLEADDAETLAAVRDFPLPNYFDVVVVPAEGQRTKPKACNYGLQLARGEYVVIYDAEDIPEPDQLTKRPSLCSAAQPATWAASRPSSTTTTRARTSSPGGSAWSTRRGSTSSCQACRRWACRSRWGSSNHLPISVLREIGAWDPNNVTEDADLGMRLLRRGYRTAVLDSTTMEEANSDFVNWMRQRSRWGKGYAITWWVQMRHPIRLLRDAGLGGFIAIQLTLGGTYILALLNLLMWSLTTLWFLTYLGFIEQLFPGWIYFAALVELLFGNFFFLYMGIWSAEYRRDYGSPGSRCWCRSTG